MKGKQTEIENHTDQELVEAVATLHQTTLADDQLSCQVCNEPINEGDEVICHLQSPAEQNRYEITQTRCTDHDDLTELLTLGVGELVIDGRVGRCSDQATQQSWPVLLSPQLRVVSSASTTTAREITAHPANRDDPVDPLTVEIPDDVEVHHSGKVTANTTTEWQEATLERWEQPDTPEDDC